MNTSECRRRDPVRHARWGSFLTVDLDYGDNNFKQVDLRKHAAIFRLLLECKAHMGDVDESVFC